MHVNNLKATDARHGHGECLYDSGSSYVGQWQHDRRWGRGKFVFACGDVYVRPSLAHPSVSMPFRWSRGSARCA